MTGLKADAGQPQQEGAHSPHGATPEAPAPGDQDTMGTFLHKATTAMTRKHRPTWP